MPTTTDGRAERVAKYREVADDLDLLRRAPEDHARMRIAAAIGNAESAVADGDDAESQSWAAIAQQIGYVNRRSI